ncbi:hypothetical protein C1910_11970 [Listeria ivanovii]|uniref:hypothetical protein n=1 Tax=Listeria ivanovii TaxID=1638 RepID=UPI00065DD76D|nr:hypothetical protein [Listeria ivanovii]PZG37226.1 hypothetical protein C1910_11970 [Listeria ivanovii]
MNQIILAKKPYTTFNYQFTNVFSLDNCLPQNVFSSAFHSFYIFDMDYFYEEIGWKWILAISTICKEQNLFFTSTTEENTNYTVAEIPNSLEPKEILEQIDILENESEDKKSTFFLTFNEACLFSTSGTWGMYFVNEFNFVILAVKKDFPKPASFSNLESMSLEEFTEHFQEWSVWLENDNIKFLKVFNKTYFE